MNIKSGEISHSGVEPHPRELHYYMEPEQLERAIAGYCELHKGTTRQQAIQAIVNERSSSLLGNITSIGATVM